MEQTKPKPITKNKLFTEISDIRELLKSDYLKEKQQDSISDSALVRELFRVYTLVGNYMLYELDCPDNFRQLKTQVYSVQNILDLHENLLLARAHQDEKMFSADLDSLLSARRIILLSNADLNEAIFFSPTKRNCRELLLAWGTLMLEFTEALIARELES
jgi:hypothetical protein